MKILRVKLDRFGALQGEFSFDPAHVTVLVDDNERGKSTLLAAITAGLYGLEDDRRSHRVVTPRERWRPWNGGNFRVELEVDADGRRLTIKRDFERDTIEIFDDRGGEVTAEFRDGKDRFPVGQKLLGLDVEEFIKCSCITQGEVQRVIPSDPRDRSGSSLRARLESAADSKLGDMSATEAVKHLDAALKRYQCAELDSTLQVDTTIQRLELKRKDIEVQLHTLEHDLDQIREPLEALARLEEDERTARAELTNLEAERQSALAGDVRRQLDDDAKIRAEVTRLEEEAAGLAQAAHLPVTSEASLRETVGRYEEAKRNLEALEARRREEISRERESLTRELADLEVYAKLPAGDADRCVTLASELRRISEDDERLREEVFTLRDGLASSGHEPERLQWLQERFGSLPAERVAVLRRQSDMQLAYQTEVATLERERTQGSEVLREIDAMRNRWLMPGWFFVALGLASAVAGGSIMILNGLQVLWTGLLAGGAGLLAIGGILLGVGARARSGDREDGLRQLTESQRKLSALKQARAETDVTLQVLSRQMGYRDQVDLLREWNEYARLSDESAPALRAQQQLSSLDQRRREALEQSREVLASIGGGDPDPERLESVANKIRRSHSMLQAARDLERRFSWIDDERRVVEAQAAGLHERAIRILQSAGLSYEPTRTWDEHAQELAGRVQGRVRWATITEHLLPAQRIRLLDPSAVEALQSQLASIEAGLASFGARTPRTPVEIETESRRTREELDQVIRRRTDLRVQVEETERRCRGEHPVRVLEKERVEAALLRARRFKHAVETARDTIQKVAADTHRRWADYLNERVSTLLNGIGSGIQQLRFGDDLDFSIKVADGQQLARGKADLQLSAGARDQLYFAVRLAVSEFLSRGHSPVPFLLDDVFVTSDDDRTRAAMKLLIAEFANEHQVILLTCHRKRHEALAALDPELYAARVRWVDANAFSRAS
ncbi:MAG: AAA family ATPase [Candidatus Eisenbacteria bacterium]|uniref:AAA family ATPase n=1 Tax=Eiseniibacteriota bacterium TaxID=2212470 RepID=A0A849SLK3_UNCEI|nr:AAA family ATPase [Candidatus Eisenbacteria bacterium]